MSKMKPTLLAIAIATSFAIFVSDSIAGETISPIPDNLRDLPQIGIDPAVQPKRSRSPRTLFVSKEEIRPFVEFVNEVSERRQRMVYLPNRQSIFNGVNQSFVNVGTGNLTLARRDLVVVDVVPIVVSRFYDSRMEDEGDFGQGWALSAAEYLEVSGDNSITFRDEFGDRLSFVGTGGKFTMEVPRPTDIRALERTSRTNFEMTFSNGTRKIFRLIEGKFRIASTHDRNGNTLRFGYQNGRLKEVESHNGKSVIIHRDAFARISSIADRDGRSVSFNYDDYGRLVSVFDLGRNKWGHEYNSSGQMSKAFSPKGELEIAAEYAGDKVSDVWVRGENTSFVYSRFDGRTVVTDEAGRSSEFFQNDKGITYRAINAVGTESKLSLDHSNRVRTISVNGEAVGRFSYNSDGRLAESEVRNGSIWQKTRFEFGENGLIGAATRSHASYLNNSYSYDDNGNLVGVRQGPDFRHYQYDQFGVISGLDIENGPSYSIENNAFGLPIRVENELGQNLELRYTRSGMLSSIRFANGEWQTYEYDAIGTRRQLSQSYADGVRYHYTASGSLSQLSTKPERADPEETIYTIDENQRLRQITSRGNSYSYDYDIAGNPTRIDGDDIDIKFLFDDLNRMTGVTADGVKLYYRYQDGESDLRFQFDPFTRNDLSGKIDTGSMTTSATEITFNRVRNNPYNVVEYSDNSQLFRTVGEHGVIEPDTLLQTALTRSRLLEIADSGTQAAKFFSAPSNAFFVPREFDTINCNVCPPEDPQSSPGLPGDLYLETISRLSDNIAACGSPGGGGGGGGGGTPPNPFEVTNAQVTKMTGVIGKITTIGQVWNAINMALHAGHIAGGTGENTVLWALRDIDAYRQVGLHVTNPVGSMIAWQTIQVDWGPYGGNNSSLTYQQVLNNFLNAAEDPID